ncbi:MULTISPECIES: YolD-like family protein [unclassified Priestia]|uniref:YolD-like family protein n=1 Tax=unclassified Priestia TaxID=2800374 RepID=UPI003672D316
MEYRERKKWLPFATLPEQYIGLKEIIDKQSEVAQPVLTEEQMEQMNFTLIEALHTNKPVYLTYYKRYNRDRVHSVCCFAWRFIYFH